MTAKGISVPQKARASLGLSLHTDSRGLGNMVMVDVTVAGYPVEAMVDAITSAVRFQCTSVPKAYADALIQGRLPRHAGRDRQVNASRRERERR